MGVGAAEVPPRLAAMLLLSASVVAARAWSGPGLAVKHSQPGYPYLALAGHSKQLPPFWLNLNNQGHANISAIVVQIIRARDAGLPLLAVQLSDGQHVPPVSFATAQIMSLIQQHHPGAAVIVRWPVGEGSGITPSSDWAVVLQNISRPGCPCWHGVPYYCLGHECCRQPVLLPILALDSVYPGMIAGVLIESLETGEWFMPPADP
eukprot:gene4131-4458_t